MHFMKTRARLYLCILVMCLGACKNADTETTGTDNSNSTLFWFEPTTSTLIGVGQTINIFTALKASTYDLFPSYVAPTAITWTSSQSSVATVSNATVVGVSEGATVITGTYLTHSSQITVQVSGTMINRSLTVSGQGTRSYGLYTPNFGSTTGPHPVVLAFHGGGGSAMNHASISMLNKLAQAQKFYVAYPEGSGVIQTFNGGACCGAAKTNNTDDVYFTRHVLDDLEAKFSIDTSKIFATGFSNGGIMSHRLACALSDRIDGIAAVGGASGEFDSNSNQYYTCSPTNPIPILHIHINNDRNYPIGGGLGTGISETPFYSVASTISDWLARNNLTAAATTEIVTPTTTCYKYTTVSNGGNPSAPVTNCVVSPIDIFDSVNEIVFGGGHSWPGGVRSLSTASDTPPTDFDANSYMWSFWN